MTLTNFPYPLFLTNYGGVWHSPLCQRRAPSCRCAPSPPTALGIHISFPLCHCCILCPHCCCSLPPTCRPCYNRKQDRCNSCVRLGTSLAHSVCTHANLIGLAIPAGGAKAASHPSLTCHTGGAWYAHRIECCTVRTPWDGHPVSWSCGGRTSATSSLMIACTRQRASARATTGPRNAPHRRHRVTGACHQTSRTQSQKGSKMACPLSS